MLAGLELGLAFHLSHAVGVFDARMVRIYRRLGWGPTILGENGQVNRHAVAEIVFNDPQQLDRLEQLIHPLVHEGRQKLRRQYQQDAQWVAIVEDCPLLFEKNLDKQCDTIIFVDATEANRQQRLTKNRGWTMQEWTHREKNQMALDIKRQHADYIVDNNASEQACFDRVRFVLSQILKGPS